MRIFLLGLRRRGSPARSRGRPQGSASWRRTDRDRKGITPLSFPLPQGYGLLSLLLTGRSRKVCIRAPAHEPQTPPAAGRRNHPNGRYRDRHALPVSAARTTTKSWIRRSGRGRSGDPPAAGVPGLRAHGSRRTSGSTSTASWCGNGTRPESRSTATSCRDGIERAATGRLDEHAMDALVTEIEEQLRAEGGEVGSDRIGVTVLERLRGSITLRTCDSRRCTRASRISPTSSAKWWSSRRRPNRSDVTPTDRTRAHRPRSDERAPHHATPLITCPTRTRRRAARWCRRATPRARPPPAADPTSGASRCAIDQSVSPGRATTVVTCGLRSGAVVVVPPSAAPACTAVSRTPKPSAVATRRRRQ